MVDSEAQIRRDICDAGRRLWDLGLIGAGEGNITARLSESYLLCTPSGVSKGHLEPSDIITIDLAGKSTDGGTPSSEIKLHLQAYKRRPDCQAVVHAHPLIATSFSVASKPIPDNLLPEASYVLGPVAMVPFTYPGTSEVSEGIDPFLADHKTFLLSHHGAATLGSTVWDACNRMETLERIATILMHAHTLGGAVPLPDNAVSRLRDTADHGALT